GQIGNFFFWVRKQILLFGGVLFPLIETRSRDDAAPLPYALPEHSLFFHCFSACIDHDAASFKMREAPNLRLRPLLIFHSHQNRSRVGGKNFTGFYRSIRVISADFRDDG